MSKRSGPKPCEFTCKFANFHKFPNMKFSWRKLFWLFPPNFFLSLALIKKRIDEKASSFFLHEIFKSCIQILSGGKFSRLKIEIFFQIFGAWFALSALYLLNFLLKLDLLFVKLLILWITRTKYFFL